MNYRVEKFREARSLAKNFPERFKLIAKISNSHLVWCLYELKELSANWTLKEESHRDLAKFGWSKTFDRVSHLAVNQSAYRPQEYIFFPETIKA